MNPEQPAPDGGEHRQGHTPNDDRAAFPNETPVTIGSALHDDEAALRATLHAEADRISPHHRLDAILAASHADAERRPARRPWLVPVAAAAAAVVVVGGVLVVNHRPSASSTLIGGPTVSASSSPGTAAPSTAVSPSRSTVPTKTAAPPATVTPPSTPSAPSGSPSPRSTTSSPTTSSPTTSSPSTPPATTSPTAPRPAPVFTTAAVPVYYVGARPGGGQSLYREFVSARMAAPASSTRKVEAALGMAMGAPPSRSGYVALWAGVDVSSVALGSGEIRVGLTRGLTRVSAAQGAVAVQQLVWTAQAAAKQGALPVRFELVNGAADLAPGQPASVRYTRPVDPGEVFTLLSPLWIDRPSRGAVVSAAADVTVTGVASTNEGSVSWQLLGGGAVAADGAVPAAGSAPARVPFTIPLGRLRAGDYVIRVFANSPKDGSVSAEQRIPFTAR